MSSSADFFIKQALGEDFLQSLQKFELYKPGTRTVLDHEEIKTALQIVPRAIMSFLVSNLSSMNVGETKELRLPLKDKNPLLRVSKVERDVFNGEIEDDTEKYKDKKVAEFKYRSIPGVGLVVMSTFELYDVEDLAKKPVHEVPSPTLELVQKMIDDCLMMHSLIDQVKENKISERDAIQQLMLAKLSEGLPTERKTTSMENRIARMKERKGEPAPEPKPTVNVVNVNISPEIKVENKVKIKGSPLKEFLDSRQKKLKKSEYAITLTKGEDVTCPDCGQHIFKNEVFSGCVCYGDDMDKKVYLAKSDEGMKVRFGRGWDPENIEMLLEVLRRKRG